MGGLDHCHKHSQHDLASTLLAHCPTGSSNVQPASSHILAVASSLWLVATVAVCLAATIPTRNDQLASRCLRIASHARIPTTTYARIPIATNAVAVLSWIFYSILKSVIN